MMWITGLKFAVGKSPSPLDWLWGSSDLLYSDLLPWAFYSVGKVTRAGHPPDARVDEVLFPFPLYYFTAWWLRKALIYLVPFLLCRTNGQKYSKGQAYGIFDVLISWHMWWTTWENLCSSFSAFILCSIHLPKND